MTIIRSAYSKRPRVQISFDQPSLTKQSFKDECDINNILAKYQKTGAITHANNNSSQYGFASSDDFTTAMQLVATAQTMFNELPSSLRDKFNHDPAQFLEYTQNAENQQDMLDLGLITIPNQPSQPLTETEETEVIAPATSVSEDSI